MSTLRFAAICAFGLLTVSCSSPAGPGGVTSTQEFNPATSRWESSNRVVVTPPGQRANPVVAPAPAPAVATDASGAPVAAQAQPEEKPGMLKKTGNALKAPFKWLPGVD